MPARSCLVMGSIMAMAATSYAGHHETMWAIQETPLHARPHETSPTRSKANKGDALTLIGIHGRWLKVRNGRRVGWVTLSQLEDRKPVPPRTRTERSGFSGKAVTDAVKVTIEIDRVRGFDDPRTKSNSVLDLARGDVVSVIGRGHGGWLLVEAGPGTVGWIPGSAVADAGRFVGDPRQAPDGIPIVDDDAAKIEASIKPRPAPSRFQGMLLATVGAQTFAMRQSSDAETMGIAKGTMAAIHLGLRARVLGDVWIGVAGVAERGTADLDYYAASEQSAPMATHELVVDASAAVGWGGDSYVMARGGFHDAWFSVESDRAEPMLVGEQVAGVTVGLGGGVPLGQRLSLSADIDVMPAGVQRPSEALPGALHATGVQGAWTHTTLAFRLPARMVAAVAYHGTYMRAALTDGAATPILATRTDQSHVVTAGLGVTW